MFIPSTLSGDPYDSEDGSPNQEVYNENMDLATEVYIHCCNQTPFGTAVINLFKGAFSEKAQTLTSRRENLLQFLASRTSACVLQETDFQTFTAILKWFRIYRKDTTLMLVAPGNLFLVLFVVMKTIVHIQCIFKANLKKIFAGIQGDLQLFFPMAC